LSSNNKNRVSKYEARRKLLVRIMAIFLVALMLLGTVAVIIPYLGIGSYAADTSEAADMGLTSGLLQDTETADIRTGDEPVRIGLMYGTGVTVGFEVRADHGMYFGHVIDNIFTPIWQTEKTLVSATSDSNLTKSGMTYSVTQFPEAAVGGWHIEAELTGDSNLFAPTYTAMSQLVSQFGLTCFPAYINGMYVIRIGQYKSEGEAAAVLGQLAPAVGNAAVLKTVPPSLTGVSVIDPNTDTILFEYDSPDSALGITPIQAGEEETYLVTPAKNLYEGIFEFTRYRSGSTDGVALTNILSLDDYVAGVLPYEISNTWPEEVQKAFAVTVRTFTLSMLGRHESTYGFDMCNSTHCQAYMGCRRANEAVRNAVAATSGTALTYNGELAHTYYSAVTGGVTVDIRDAWGGKVEYPYLKAVATPWEDYAGHKNGAWTVEVTPAQLAETLASKGYNVRGSIMNITVNSYAENSSYIKSISFTDSYGTTVTINTTDKVRTALSKYLNSSNFVVGRGGSTVSVNNYQLATAVPIVPPSNKDSGETDKEVKPSISHEALQSGAGVSILTADGIVYYTPGESITYAKDIGAENTVNLSTLTVLTGEGKVHYDMTSEYYANYTEMYEQAVSSGLTVTNTAGELPSLMNILSYQTIVSSESVTLPGSPMNFVFMGRGWGHGVGLSQYGALNLAQLGYDAESILAAYFPGTAVTPIIR